MKKKLTIEFEEISRDAKIDPSCFHSMDGGQSFRPLRDPYSVGKKPEEFSASRSFWKIVEILVVEDAD